MKKFKLFIDNFLIYGFGGIISKVIPLIMLPVVTRLMPNSSDYAISDLSNTVVSICSALAVMGMYDAMYRMFFERDDEEYKKNICSTALTFTLGTSLVVFLVMLVLKDFIAQVFFADRSYAYLVYITAIATLVGSTNSIISAPTRMQNKRRIFLITNTLSPILSYSISIPLLLSGHYIIALPLASAVSSLTLEVIFGFLNHNWFDIRRFDPKLLKPLLQIAIPLMPNFLIYWVFNSCDKIMITNILGTGAAGIYSVGSKLGAASQLIYTAFAGGWQYFAFSTMKEKNQVHTTSVLLEYLGAISFVAGAFMCAWSYPIFRLMFTGEYVDGYEVAPFLFLAPLLQMLFQVECNQFLVIRKTWPNILILSAGAISNVLINYFLIPVLGIEGAALATLLGYIISNIVCSVVLCKMKLLEISHRFLLTIGITVVYMVLWRFFFRTNVVVSTLLAIVLTGSFVKLFRSELQMMFAGLRRMKMKNEGL